MDRREIATPQLDIELVTILTRKYHVGESKAQNEGSTKK
jgi:hypothetical protein